MYFRGWSVTTLVPSVQNMLSDVLVFLLVTKILLIDRSGRVPQRLMPSTGAISHHFRLAEETPRRQSHPPALGTQRQPRRHASRIQTLAPNAGECRFGGETRPDSFCPIPQRNGLRVGKYLSIVSHSPPPVNKPRQHV